MVDRLIRKGIAAAAIASVSCSGVGTSESTFGQPAAVSAESCDSVDGSGQEVFKCSGATVTVTERTADFVRADVTVTREGIPETGKTTRISLKLNSNSTDIGFTVRTGDNTILVPTDPSALPEERFRPREITYPDIRRSVENITDDKRYGKSCPTVSVGTTNADVPVAVYTCPDNFTVVVKHVDTEKKQIEASVESSSGINPEGARVREKLGDDQVLHTYFSGNKNIDVYNTDGAVGVFYNKGNLS